MLTMPTYAIRTSLLFIRDQRERYSPDLSFHLRSGDYLAAVATFLGVISEGLRDNLRDGRPPQEVYINILEDLRKDFQYLHKEYQIEPKQID